MKRHLAVFLTALTCAVLAGCVAAALPLMSAASVGMGAFMGYKTVQSLSGGGTIEVQLDDKSLTPGKKEELKRIKKLAVWPTPGSNSAAAFTEELGDSGRYEPISPARVSQAIKKNNGSEAVDQFTKREFLQLANRICQDTGAEGLIFSRRGVAESKSNILSLDRPKMVYRGTVVVYSRGSADYLVEMPLQVIVDLARDRAADSSEADIAASKAIAKRMVELGT